jgi:hypothetical protein
MRKIFLLFFFLFLTFVSNVDAQIFKENIPLTIAYFGETIVHPGVYIGSEHSLNNAFIVSLGIGTYLHYRHHRGFFVYGIINWRKTFSFGYGMEYGFGLGYLHTWEHGGKTYVVDDYGNVREKNNWGRPSLMPILRLGVFNWDFRKNTNMPLRLFYDIVIFGQYPYNNYIMPHIALKIGGTYYLKAGKE